MGWRLITYRLPAEPSRHRVAVRRELRRLASPVDGLDRCERNRRIVWPTGSPGIDATAAVRNSPCVAA